MALLPGSPAINAGTSGPQHPRHRPARPGPGRRRRHRRLREPGLHPHACRRQHPADSKIGTAFANPLAVTVTANNPVEPVNGGVVSFVANPAANGATAIFFGPLGRHRQRPGRRHRRAQQRRRQLHRRRVGLGFVPVFVRSDEHRPGLRGPGREYDERFPRPGAGLLSLREAIVFANTDSLGKLEHHL